MIVDYGNARFQNLNLRLRFLFHSSSGYHVIQNMISAGSLSLFKPMESWGEIYLEKGVTLPEFRRIPTAFLARVAPACENTSAEYWAFLRDNTPLDLPLPIFFSCRLLSPPSRIPVQFDRREREKGELGEFTDAKSSR